MEASDKIFVDKFGHVVEGYIPDGCYDIVYYIRKDYLIEWLKERRAEHSFEVRKAYQRTIEKIESL